MTNRPDPMTAEQQAMLGRLVAAERLAGRPWKLIERELGMSRRQLWRCVVRWRMAQNSRRMAHQAA